MQPELTAYAKLSACSASLPLTGRLLVRVNATSREDLNWGWKSHWEDSIPITAGKVTQDLGAGDQAPRPLFKTVRNNKLGRFISFSENGLL